MPTPIQKTGRARCAIPVSRPRWTSMPNSCRSHNGAHWRRCLRWSGPARQSRLRQTREVFPCRRNRGWWISWLKRIVESQKVPIGAKNGRDDGAKSLKRWWPGTELNRRRQPFQCSRPKLSIDSTRHSSENLPDFVLFIGAKNGAKQCTYKSEPVAICLDSTRLPVSNTQGQTSTDYFRQLIPPRRLPP